MSWECWEVELVGPEEECKSWFDLVRQEGYRICETVDDEGRYATAVWVCERGHVQHLSRLAFASGIGASFSPLHDESKIAHNLEIKDVKKKPNPKRRPKAKRLRYQAYYLARGPGYEEWEALMMGDGDFDCLANRLRQKYHREWDVVEIHDTETDKHVPIELNSAFGEAGPSSLLAGVPGLFALTRQLGWPHKAELAGRLLSEALDRADRHGPELARILLNQLTPEQRLEFSRCLMGLD